MSESVILNDWIIDIAFFLDFLIIIPITIGDFIRVSPKLCLHYNIAIVIDIRFDPSLLNQLLS